MLRPALLAFACLCLAAGHAGATDSSPLAVANDIYALIAETTMVTIEVEPVRHAANARAIIEQLDATLPEAVNAVTGKDTVRAADLMAQWQDLKSAYEGEPFAIAFREQTYDTNLTARYTSGSDALLMALDAAATTEAAASPVRQLRLQLLKTVASYLRLTTGIVGGTSFSANDADNDLPTGVASVDRQLAALKQALAGKAQAAELQRAAARWSFLRPALLKTSDQSSPFIVYTQGIAAAQSLAKIDSATPAR